jgi:hypothetical protein
MYAKSWSVVESLCSATWSEAGMVGGDDGECVGETERCSSYLLEDMCGILARQGNSLIMSVELAYVAAYW